MNTRNQGFPSTISSQATVRHLSAHRWVELGLLFHSLFILVLLLAAFGAISREIKNSRDGREPNILLKSGWQEMSKADFHEWVQGEGRENHRGLWFIGTRGELFELPNLQAWLQVLVLGWPSPTKPGYLCYAHSCHTDQWLPDTHLCLTGPLSTVLFPHFTVAKEMSHTFLPHADTFSPYVCFLGHPSSGCGTRRAVHPHTIHRPLPDVRISRPTPPHSPLSLQIRTGGADPKAEKLLGLKKGQIVFRFLSTVSSCSPLCHWLGHSTAPANVCFTLPAPHKCEVGSGGKECNQVCFHRGLVWWPWSPREWTMQADLHCEISLIGPGSQMK